MGPQRAAESLFGVHAAACSSAFLLGHPAAAAPPPLSSWASWRSLVSPLEFPLAAAAPPPSSEGILALYCTPRGRLGFGAQIRTTPRHPGTSGPFSPSASSTLSLPGPSPRRRPRLPRENSGQNPGKSVARKPYVFTGRRAKTKIRAKSGQNPGKIRVKIRAEIRRKSGQNPAPAVPKSGSFLILPDSPSTRSVLVDLLLHPYSGPPRREHLDIPPRAASAWRPRSSLRRPSVPSWSSRPRPRKLGFGLRQGFGIMFCMGRGGRMRRRGMRRVRRMATTTRTRGGGPCD